MKSKTPSLYHPGEIVLVRFPFSDLESSKKRPALCLSSHRLTDKIQIVVVAMVTSKIENFALEGDYLLSDWEEAGLLHPSLVRLAKIASLDLVLIEKKLGKITAQDSDKISSHFKRIFNHWL
ncbi:type II toxin-antitoxin system PemK/MazF family toxin [Bdellovibrionota bacterium FG-2]